MTRHVPKGREVQEPIEPMLQSLTIKGFRGFEHITLSSLDRINLITGRNNVGKTALLDALFIQLGGNNPELLLRTNIFRGIERFDLDPEEIWGSFFYNRQIDRTIEIVSMLANDTQQTVRISLQTSKSSKLNTRKGTPAQSRSLSTVQMKRDMLVLEYRGKGETYRVCATIEAKGEVKYDRDPVPNLRPGAYFAARNRSLQEDAARFSKLERVGRDQEIVELMKIVDTRLRNLSVLVTGGLPLIHADIGTGELIPVPMMGEGMSRMLSIIAGIMSYEGGAILIDEIENGLHYSVLPQVWTAIAESARKNHVQIFATTHSWECILAAHHALEHANPYDFRLHRLERIDDAITVIPYDMETIETSLDLNLEMR